MKITVCLFFLFSTNLLWGQINLFRQLKTEVTLIECNHKGDTIKPLSEKTIPQGSKFTVQKNLEGGYVVKFWTWSLSKQEDSLNQKMEGKVIIEKSVPTTNLEKYQNINFKPDGSYRYFLLSEWQYTNQSKDIVARFEPIYGLTTIPFKIRKGFDITKDIEIGGSVGVKYNVAPNRDFSINVLVGIGYSNVTLDSLNTRGKITQSADYSAFTLHGGVVFDWKKVQLGLFLGGDLLPKKNINDWISHKKIWFGIGLGFSIFEHSIPTKEQPKQ